MAKANNLFYSYKEMYKALRPDYAKNYVNEDKINEISLILKDDSSESLFCVSSIIHYLKLKIDYNAARTNAELLRFIPDVKFLYFFLKSADNRLVGKVMSYAYPKVETNDMLYVNNGIFDDWFETTHDYGLEHRTLKAAFNLAEVKLEEVISKDAFKPRENAQFGIRYINAVKCPLASYLKGKSKFLYKDRLKFKKVILHVHGGGFICMSSASHESYLTTIARKTRAPIFSIDYPLAPLNKALDITEAIFKAYLFILVKS